MTMDRNGQYQIDFSTFFTPNKRSLSCTSRRKSVSEFEAVPENEISALNTVRLRSGITCAQISEVMELVEGDAHGGFVARVLSGRQRISRSDYYKIFFAMAQLVFKMIVDA